MIHDKTISMLNTLEKSISMLNTDTLRKKYLDTWYRYFWDTFFYIFWHDNELWPLHVKVTFCFVSLKLTRSALLHKHLFWLLTNIAWLILCVKQGGRNGFLLLLTDSVTINLLIFGFFHDRHCRKRSQISESTRPLENVKKFWKYSTLEQDQGLIFSWTSQL